MYVTARLDGVEADVHALLAALDTQVLDGLRDITDLIANDAIATHAFENRTGVLEGSISSYSALGSWLDGSLEGEVIATADYASYVEERWGGRYAYLGPAFEHQEDRADGRLETALRIAAAEAGWTD